MNRTLLTLLVLICHVWAIGQVIVSQNNYSELKFGVYLPKSIDSRLIGTNPRVIEPQIKFTEGEQIAFLKIEDEYVALFDKINDTGTCKPVGVLSETSVVQVDTIFYREIYKDTTKEWFVTFNVWYALTINGKHYYTDYKIHDFISYKRNLDKYSQKLLLVSQSTGYDEFYDNGYPDYFFVAVLNDKNELLFESSILDFDFGNEFWEPELVKSKMTEKGFEFTIIGLDQSFNATWTGKELINRKHE